MNRRTNLKTWVAISIFLLAMGATAAGKVIYVDANAPGANNGSSWADAYQYLGYALDNASSGDDIHVAQGIYRPSEGYVALPDFNWRTTTFQLRSGVAIKGGYAGYGQPDPNARDIKLYETILSGDLDGNDVEVNDPCDLLTEPTRAENSYHVVTGSSTDATAVLDGFIITGGNANEYLSFLDDDGGGMCNYSGSPTVSNCIFNANSAYCGGGMHNEVSSPTVTNCAFISNAALTAPRGQAGGGLSNSVFSNPVLNCCIFVRNFGYGSGGGIRNDYECNAILKNCVFAGNRSMRFGGGMIIDDSDITLVNCTFVGNLATSGNGLAFDSPGHKFPSSALITNSILWDGGSEIQNFDNSIIVITYSGVKGGWLGEGNINTDPCFANVGYWDLNGTPEDANDDFWIDGDYHLKSQAGRWDANNESWVKDDVTSPCIDAGNPGCPLGDEPEPNGNRRNMGAYGGTAEASKSPAYWRSIADLTNDWTVDFNDLAVFVDYWLETGECIPSDLNRSQFVDFSDFAIFGQQWADTFIAGPGIGKD